MEFVYDLPAQGCNVFYGTYIDNYNGNTRSRYYLNDGHLVLSSTSNANSTPNGVHCLTSDDMIIYKPEIEVYFNIIAILAAFVIFSAAYKLIIFPFWRKIK